MGKKIILGQRFMTFYVRTVFLHLELKRNIFGLLILSRCDKCFMNEETNRMAVEIDGPPQTE